MKTQTTAVARQQRLNSWAQMVHECQNRPIGMTVDEWCAANSITKANYYYRMTEVRKACLKAMPPEVVEQAIVPVSSELMTMDVQISSDSSHENSSSLELNLNGIVIRVTEQTSTELLSKVLGVIAHVK